MQGLKKTDKIFLRVPNWLGDAVISLPALSALKGLYPQARITVLAKPGVSPIYENNPDVSSIIVYEGGGRLGGMLKLAMELKKEKFDLAVLFQNAFEAALISFLARISERAGYARDLRTALLTRPVRLTEEIRGRHQVFYYLNIIKKLGGSVSFTGAPLPVIYLNGDEIKKAERFMEGNGFGRGGLFFGVSPGASYGPAKRWGIEGFREVIERITGDIGASAVIFGGKDDAGVAEKLSGRLTARHLNLAGKTTLREFIALATLMRFFICNDSGPMHVAAALGVPTVAIFGSTDPFLTGPLGKRVSVLRKKIECSPCFKRQCPFGHYRCMSVISAEDVYAASKAVFKEAV